MSYYFNQVIKNNYKDYGIKFNGSTINFRNQKDSTYLLQISINGSKKEATISDLKNRLLIKFDVDFDYKNISDLHKLSNSKLYTKVGYGKIKHFKNTREEFEFVNDTVTNKKIIHLTQFKNKTSKKIVNEHYYFFGKNQNLTNTSKKSLKHYLANKYNIIFENDENLEKILHLKDGKISSETEILYIEETDFNFTFKIDEVFPKHTNN